MPDSYVRSTDRAVMIEFSTGMYVSAHMAEFLGLVASDVVEKVVKSHKRRAAA